MSREIRNLDDILYIVMPAYNEEANIESVVRSWYPNLEGKDARSRLVIADSGSTDGTHAVLRRLQEELPQKVLTISRTAHMVLFIHFRSGMNQ